MTTSAPPPPPGTQLLRPPDGGPPAAPDFSGALLRETVLLPPLVCSLASGVSRSMSSFGHTTSGLDSNNYSNPRQYRPRPKIRATRSWYRRSHLAILALKSRALAWPPLYVTLFAPCPR